MMITGAIATGEGGTDTTGGTAITAGTTGDQLNTTTPITAGVRQAIITGVAIITTTVIPITTTTITMVVLHPSATTTGLITSQ